jgi:signal transduction histidine kinase
MKVNTIIRNLLIGNHNFVMDWVGYKVALLRGRLSLLCFAVVSIYICFDIFNGVTVLIPSYLGVMVVSLITIFLNRRKKYVEASFAFLGLINIMTYVFAVNDSSQSGVSIFFLMSALTSMVFFGYDKRLFVFIFCGLSVFLFLSAYLFPLKFLVFTGGDMDLINSPKYREVSFVINFLGGFFLCVSIVYFLIDLNFHSQKEILTKNQLLAKTNKELDHFVYSASHDLRAPLTSMLGLIEITNKTDDLEEIRLCHSMMKNRIHNLDAFIKEIIDFSRNAKQEVNKERVLLLPLLKEIIEDYKFTDGVEEIYVRFTVAEDFAIVTDSARLKVILSNLIGNAYKYHDIEKEQQEVMIKAEAEGDQVRIEIEDNGLGIAAEHQPRIFEMFYRASEKSHGSGLGLYIVKETLTKLNGSIKVHSLAGQGSRFTIRMPNL